jgi:hypothetical protein
MAAAPPKAAPAAKKAPPKKADGEKKPRAPRKDYGFAKDATIKMATEEKTYRGKRKEMYEALQKSAGKTVQHYLDNNKNEKDPPRGWLRFFVQDGACTLEGGTKAADKKETAE